jgi:hypothetical protein
MKVTVKKEEEINVKYFCGSIDVRYWEDADINGIDDISYEEQKEGAKPRMPLVVENPNARYNDEKWLWEIKINLETGNIEGWPAGNKAHVHYKVCDQGIYWLEDENGNEIHRIDCYVPHLLEIGDDCPDGDYIIITIDENGHIVEWEDANIDRLVEDFMETEGF